MNWDDMKVFLAVASTGGVRKASNQLKVHNTSVVRRIKIFEDDLGEKLFDCERRGHRAAGAGFVIDRARRSICEM